MPAVHGFAIELSAPVLKAIMTIMTAMFMMAPSVTSITRDLCEARVPQVRGIISY